MKREYLDFLKSTETNEPPKPARSALQDLGWQSFFAQQIDIEDLAKTPPVRVTEVHRNGLQIVGDNIDLMIPPGPEATVGDWLLLNQDQPDRSQLLERKSLIQRRAAGHDRRVQLIAANIDTAFIVSSCNADFNVARLERYIALAFEADVAPVIVLTKADLVTDVGDYVKKAERMSASVPVICLDARGEQPQSKLAAWCGPGQTVAFLGSSGVGKSTLTNALAGSQKIETQSIREDDAKGRHTTTRRQLHFLSNGCAVLDTPGMRELQLTDVKSGIANLFSDIEELTGQCRFNDCSHTQEPGCAVLEALAKEEIDVARVQRWRKLIAEEQYNTATLAERRAKDRSFGKLIRQVQKDNRK
ncbi:MAG: ribosome small subunit-dependent GTPase A [Rhizobiaceae bacterium]|nr:ribosome small subunit-dependent GTPase A [Rhizobiaceae bacterium]